MHTVAQCLCFKGHIYERRVSFTRLAKEQSLPMFNVLGLTWPPGIELGSNGTVYHEYMLLVYKTTWHIPVMSINSYVEDDTIKHCKLLISFRREMKRKKDNSVCVCVFPFFIHFSHGESYYSNVHTVVLICIHIYPIC